MTLPQENMGDKDTNVPISTQPSLDEFRGQQSKLTQKEDNKNGDHR